MSVRRIVDCVLVTLAGITIFQSLRYDTVISRAMVIMAQSLLASLSTTTVADSPLWLAVTKDVVATIQSLATIVALIIGAWWVLKRRKIYPRAKFTHVISHVSLHDKRVLLHVAITIENVGDVLLPIGQSVVCAQQLNPLPFEHSERLGRGGRLLPKSELEVDWPVLDRCDLDWRGNEFEPGESGAFHFDLVVPAGVKTVLVYSYFTNLSKPDREIGWNTSTVYNIA